MKAKTLKTIIAAGAILFATSAFAVTDYSSYAIPCKILLRCVAP